MLDCFRTQRCSDGDCMRSRRASGCVRTRKAHKCVEDSEAADRGRRSGCVCGDGDRGRTMVRARGLRTVVDDPAGRCREDVHAWPRWDAQSAVVVGSRRASAPLCRARRRMHGVVPDVLVDLDTGDHRTGIASGRSGAAARREITCVCVLRFGGLQAYSVRASHCASDEGRARFLTVRCWGIALETRDLLAANGIPAGIDHRCEHRNVLRDCTVSVVTELQAGSVCVHGWRLWAHRRRSSSRTRMSVMATVVSANHEDRVTVDAGFKAFSTDRPFGTGYRLALRGRHTSGRG